MPRVPSVRPAIRQRAVISVAVAALLALGLGACGRSSGGGGTGGSTPAASAAPSSSAAAAGPGDFGTLKKICGPGTPSGPTARGLSNTEIRIGVTADPGSTAAPGLEQEFFDTADGFAKWCNAAGGINGRKIVIDKWDAKLFNVGQVMTSACLKDFMLVGNGNAFDSAGVKVRVGCKLGQIPSYVVSPEAVSAPYQVQATPVPPTQINDGAIRLLAEAYPDTKTGGVGIGSSTLASIAPVGLRTAEYLRDLGIKVAVIQDQPPQVDNYRPYMEQLKGAGAVGYYGISAQDPTPIVQAMKNIGYSPSWILYSPQFYGPQAAQAAKALGSFPPSYVQFGALPFDLVGQYPVLQQAENIVKAAVSNPKLTAFTDSAFSAWTLWAESATECGNQLTQACVLQKAAAHTDWTAGGLYPPHSTALDAKASACIALVKLTPNGFVYDKSVTQPTKGDGVYNCDPENVKTVKTYQTTS